MSFRFKDDADEDVETHEINVTPFIDVMLVLLIIFMVAAPLSTVDLPVELPTSSAKAMPKPDEPVYLTLRADLTLAVGETATPLAALPAALARATKADKQARIFLRADKRVPYGELMTTLNAVQRAGYSHVALVGLEGEPAP